MTNHGLISLKRSLKGWQNPLQAQPAAHATSMYTASEYIHDHSQIDKSLPQANIGDIVCPNLIRKDSP